MAKHTEKKKGKGANPPAAEAGAAAGAAVEHWKEEPDDHDYPAAHDYLTLVATEAVAAALVTQLRQAPIAHRKAKDLLRSSRLALLAPTSPHVAADLAKVAGGQKLSPVLCIRGCLADDVALTIADGYHRVCASYHLDENATIPCHLVDPPVTAPPRPVAPRQRATTGPARPAG